MTGTPPGTPGGPFGPQDWLTGKPITRIDQESQRISVDSTGSGKDLISQVTQVKWLEIWFPSENHLLFWGNEFSFQNSFVLLEGRFSLCSQRLAQTRIQTWPLQCFFCKLKFVYFPVPSFHSKEQLHRGTAPKTQNWRSQRCWYWRQL